MPPGLTSLTKMQPQNSRRKRNKMRPKISSKSPRKILPMTSTMDLVVNPVQGVTVKEWEEVLDPGEDAYALMTRSLSTLLISPSSDS